jgi:hypothetical protein
MNAIIFRQITTYPNYEVSCCGTIRNKKTGRILKQCEDKNGYLMVCLMKNKQRNMCKVHRLVALTFLQNLENKRVVDHIDNNRQNNHFLNLRFATHQQNSMNCKLRKHNTTGLKGVFKLKSGKFVSYVNFMKKYYHLGTYETKEEASLSRLNKLRLMCPDFINESEYIAFKDQGIL